METKASRIVVMLSAVLAVLGLFLGAIALLTSFSPASIDPGSAGIGGSFDLVDQNGRPFSDQNMKGRPYLVFFGYTHCPDICPTTLTELSQLMHKLGTDADRVGALFITVDPERDTQPVLKDYMSSFDPHLRGLTGDAKAIAQVIKDYRVYAKKVALADGDYSMDHSAIVYLMDKHGHFVAPFNMQRTADAEAAELRQFF